MRRKLGWLFTFIVGAFVVALIFLRDLLMPDKAKHEAAKLDLDAKKADVEEKKADVKVVEAEAAAVHERVEEKLAAVDAKAEADAKRDSVDVANELIKG
jgi:hypothetical protein